MTAPQIHHRAVAAVCLGCDACLNGTLSYVLAFVSATTMAPSISFVCSTLAVVGGPQHFGDLVTANYWMDRVLPLFDRVLAEPNQASEALTVVLTLTFWGTYGPLLGQREKCLQFFKKRASLSLSTFGAFLASEGGVCSCAQLTSPGAVRKTSRISSVRALCSSDLEATQQWVCI